MMVTVEDDDGTFSDGNYDACSDNGENSDTEEEHCFSEQRMRRIGVRVIVRSRAFL